MREQNHARFTGDTYSAHTPGGAVRFGHNGRAALERSLYIGTGTAKSCSFYSNLSENNAGEIFTAGAFDNRNPAFVGAHSVRPLSAEYLRGIENTILPFGLRAHTVRPYRDGSVGRNWQ